LTLSRKAIDAKACENSMSRLALRGLLALVIVFALTRAIPVGGQTPTYSVAGIDDSSTIASLRRAVNQGRADAVENFWQSITKHGAPLIEPIAGEPDYSLVTFVWHGDSQTRNVVIFDGVAGFDAKDRMVKLGDTNIWYKTYRVRNDARFAYNLSPNDSLEPFDQLKGEEEMRARLAMLRTDPLNPHHCPTTFGAYGTDSSYVELPAAPRLVWNTPLNGIRRGEVEVRNLRSVALGGEKKVWVYTPAGFTRTRKRYPLLVLFDGDRNIYWIPKLLDLLIAQRRIPPMVAVMTDESRPSVRNAELACNPKFAAFLAQELVPWARSNYRATTSPFETIVAGSSYGGLAAVYSGIENAETLGNVIALSGSFWWKPADAKDGEWLVKLVKSRPKVSVRFYLEVGEMESYPIQIKSNHDMRDALKTRGYEVGYSEFDGGHSYLTWSNGMVHGLEFTASKWREPAD
jgi:enterochelin esterase-like enzyme